MEMEVSPGIFRQEKLGDEYFAVRKIQRNSALKQSIAREIVKKKSEIEMNSQKMWNFYALLVYYWRHVFPIKYKGTEADPVPIKTFEHRVIEDEMVDIGNKIKDKEGKNIQEDEVSQRLAKIDEFSGRIGNSPRRVIKF
jgi:nitrate reductase beta subunit